MPIYIATLFKKYFRKFEQCSQSVHIVFVFLCEQKLYLKRLPQAAAG